MKENNPLDTLFYVATIYIPCLYLNLKLFITPIIFNYYFLIFE